MTESQLELWFRAAPEKQRERLSEIRLMITSLAPDVSEDLKWGRPCYLAKRGLFSYLQSTKTHVSLGFQNGASLDDPRGLLQGSGKEMRHIKIDPNSEIDRASLVGLLRQVQECIVSQRDDRSA